MTWFPHAKQRVAMRAEMMNVLESVDAESVCAASREHSEEHAAEHAGAPGGRTIDHLDLGEAVVAALVALHDHGHVGLCVDHTGRNNTYHWLLLHNDGWRLLLMDGVALHWGAHIRLGWHVCIRRRHHSWLLLSIWIVILLLRLWR